MKLSHNDDGKGKFQSHTIAFLDDNDWNNSEKDIYSHNPLDITGYGETKEEALKEFLNKFEYIMSEWEAFKKMLIETDIITNDIVEVDCLGKPLNKS